jgi:transcription elongation factor GreA
MTTDTFALTLTGYERLKAELDALLAEQRELVDEMEDLYRDVDRNNDEEAADFDVRTRKEYVDQRVGHLQYVLERASVMDEDPDPQRINAGDRIIVWDVEAREELTFNLVTGEESAVIGDAVTLDSPVGKALLGHMTGDTVEVSVPDGWVRYAIRRVERVGDTES